MVRFSCEEILDAINYTVPWAFLGEGSTGELMLPFKYDVFPRKSEISECLRICVHIHILKEDK